MISSYSDEEEIVKWLFSEIINCHTDGQPIQSRGMQNWASKTRIHKIIYSVLDKFDLNITRSLYMWGGFIHNNILDEKFNYYKINYHENPDLNLKNRKKVKIYDIPIDDIIEYLCEITPELEKLDSIHNLQNYYIKYVPKEYNPLYFSKQMVIVNLNELSIYNNIIEESRFFKYLEDIKKYFSDYHLLTYDFIQNENLFELNYKFSDLIEESLEKIELHILKHEYIPKYAPIIYSESQKYFVDFLWKPYACRISQQTVTGLRAKTEQRKMKENEFNTITKSISEFEPIKKTFEKHKFEVTWDEYKELNNLKEYKDEEKIINKIIKIYLKSDDS
jgi:hypothetical protein